LILNTDTLEQAIRSLAAIDPELNQIFKLVGYPPLWERKAGFAGLLRIILEQQVSLASADATFRRLLAGVPSLTAQNFLDLSDLTLRGMGFSRQKSAYGRNLAQAVVSGSLELEALARLDDDTAMENLMALKGIGQWTADIYLLLVLRRPDIWPASDLALANAVRKAKGLDRLPDKAQMEEIARRWKPWRAAAARLLWHYYLKGFPAA
jgi:DNA-3-methyladenine glycosylase II